MAGNRFTNLIRGAEKVDNIEIKEETGSRWSVFRAILSKNLFKFILINLIGVIGALFILLLYNNRVGAINDVGAKLPFSSNFGAGYPISVGTEKLAALNKLDIDFSFFTLLIPAIVLFGIFLSGVFYIIKKMVLVGNVNVGKEFWNGFKKNVFNFVVIAALFGGILWLGNYAVSGIIGLQINGVSATANVFLIILIVLICALIVFYFIMTLYMMTLTVNYKMNILEIFKNSFLLTIGLFPRNLLITALCFFPLALMFISSLVSIVLIVYLIIGISYGVLGFTVYSQWVFERVVPEGEMTSGIFEGASVTYENPEIKKAEFFEKNYPDLEKPETVKYDNKENKNQANTSFSSKKKKKSNSFNHKKKK